MGEYVCFLITVLHEDCLCLRKCALKVKISDLTGDCFSYPMERHNCEQLHGLLPLHVRNCGPIVEVKEIFEIHEVKP